jgi:IS605 OrfB family transposase
VVEARAACIRRDGLHKLTSRLVAEHGTVVVERLNVAGMLRNRRLARAISDAGFAQLRRLLAYKTIWSGARLVQDVRPGLAGRTAISREAGTGLCPGQTGTVDAQAPTSPIMDTPR